VGATSRCTFTAEPSAAWLHVLSGDSGSGVAQVVVRVGGNPTRSERTATISIGGREVSVVQEASPAGGIGDPHMSLDRPGNGARVGTSFRITGWALDAAAIDGTPGVSTVHVWAYPNPGS